MPDNLSKNSIRPLNWLNFFAADVSDGVGPFLAVYLATNLHWKSGQIGMAIAATTFSMVLMQSPAGIIGKTKSHFFSNETAPSNAKKAKYLALFKV